MEVQNYNFGAYSESLDFSTTSSRSLSVFVQYDSCKIKEGQKKKATVRHYQKIETFPFLNIF